MTNIYYTAKTGKRNQNGHTTTRGTVYQITRRGGEDRLESIGIYSHMSGGANIDNTLLHICVSAGIMEDYQHLNFFQI